MPAKLHFPWSRYLPASLILCLGIILSLVAFRVVWRWEERRQDYELKRRVDNVVRSLKQQFRDDLEVVANTSDFIAAIDAPDREAFSQLVHRPLQTNAGIQLLAWVPRISDRERQVKRLESGQIVPPEFQIRQRTPGGGWVAAESRSQYFPALYVEPRQNNQAIWGFDLGSHPVYRQALDRARQTGQMVVTEPVEWVEGDRDRLRILAIQPLYGAPNNPSNVVTPTAITADPDTADFSDESFQGFVIGVFHLSEIFKTAIEEDKNAPFNLYIVEQTGDRPSAKPELLAAYDAERTVVLDSSHPDARLPDPDVDGNSALDVRIRKFEVGGRSWSLYVQATVEYRDIQTKHWRSWATLIIGLLWTHIPVTYLLTSLSRQRQIEQLAHERASQAAQLRKALSQLEAEQAKSEGLLLNILPQPIAERLKQEQQIIADSFPEVTVMFADIVGFTKLASRVSAPELVAILNEIFSAFDRLAVHHGLEKIKTIGDAYMVVGGLPQFRPDHAEAIAQMALDMHTELKRFDLERGETFQMRIGIHTGPVVAGVIGANKFIYDLWGDTVNIASRMESHGIPSCIQVSEMTYQHLQHQYRLEKRGAIPIKGKGEMITYLLLDRQGNRQALDARMPSLDEMPRERLPHEFHRMGISTPPQQRNS